MRPRTAIIVALVLTAAACFAQQADFEWQGSRAGITDEAPEPWAPVEVDDQRVSLWGRTITWDGGPLPSQITSQDTELLAAPIEHGVLVGGLPVEFRANQQRVVERSEAVVAFAHSTSAPRLTLETRTTVEFDGFTRITMTLTPEEEVEVSGWEMRIPLRPEVADCFSRYLNYDFAALRTDKHSFASSMRLIGGTFHEPFNPEVWVGNKQVGLTWAAETNEPWRQEDLDRAISIEPKRTRTDLVIRFIDHAVTLTEPMTVEFALVPTPLKPFDPSLRQIRFGHPSRMEGAINRGVGEGVADYYGVAFGNDYFPKWHGIPLPSDTDEARAYQAKLEDLGIGFVPYGALAYTNSFWKVPREHYEEWHTLPVSEATLKRYEQYDSGEMTEDYALNNWGHWEGYRVCMTPESYHDFFVEMYLHAIREYDIDGIYLDHGEVSHGCQNPGHEHYIDPEEQTGKYFYGIFGARECLKRLWIATKAAKPGLPIILHQSRPSKLFNSFVDICASGEVINVFFSGGHRHPVLRANPDLYVPDYDTVPPVFWEYELIEGWGFDSRLLPEVKFVKQAYWNEHPEEYALYSRTMMKNVLLSGGRLYAGNMEQAVLEECWSALDRFGPMTEDAQFHAWHEGQDLATPSLPETRVSVHTRPGRALVIVGNDAHEDVTETIALSGELPMESAVDAATGEGLDCTAGVLEIPVPARTYRLVVLE
ncbi:MAG: hypothetical protein GF393_08285 [Armatimonadia bacterium]|nr:hypothetical protein [Armatimonadia bacterium]